MDIKSNIIATIFKERKVNSKWFKKQDNERNSIKTVGTELQI